MGLYIHIVEYCEAIKNGTMKKNWAAEEFLLTQEDVHNVIF